MIIENLEALKIWLSETLEPICDADPSALAKYVVALVKKDKSEKELKEQCIEQLDVFLQKETTEFVDKLFVAIDNKSYIPKSEQPLVEDKIEKKELKKDETVSEEDREKTFSRRINYSPPQSSSRYNRDSRRVDDRKRNDRSRKRDYDRNPPRRDSYRDRYNRRRGRSYSRSRSRSWSKERPRDRDRERERDRNRDRDRDRDRSKSRSHSRSRSRSRERDSTKLKYDHDRTDRPEAADGYIPPALDSTATTSHFPVPTLSSTITVIAPTHHLRNNTIESWSEFCPERPSDHGPFARGPPPPQPRKRCRDYDEKGFCMRGDLCPFDHGSDPVVVEDVGLPNMLPFQQPPPPLPGVEPPPPPGLPPTSQLMSPPPVNLRPPVPPPGTLPPSLPPVAGPPPPLPSLQPSGMDAPPNSITSSVPTIVTSGMRASIPQAPPPLFTSESYVTDVYNPEAPSLSNTSRPMYRHRGNPERPNLIGLTMGDVDQSHREKIPNNSSRIVMESDPRKRPAGGHDGIYPPKKPWFERSNFNKPNHHGFPNRGHYASLRTKLLVLQIPPELNNISKLNEHFSKFGTIVNLQVAYQNNPEGALIQFASPFEAKRAFQSTEAVLDNRFIKVHWFENGAEGPNMGQSHSHQQTQPKTHESSPVLRQSIKDRLGPLVIPNPEPTPESTVQHKVPVKDSFGVSAKSVTSVEKGFSSTGLTRTIYTPAAPQISPEDALKKKQEALRLQQDVRKKKQEILEKTIETQKLLISKLEKNKSIKPEEKAKVMETLDMLTKSITKLQDEIKSFSGSNNMLRPSKSRAEAQRELLDAELDLFKKAQAGEDTALLKLKFTQLQIEAAKRGILAPGRGRGVATRARGRGSSWSRGRGGGRGRGRSVPMHAVIDHRPRALKISGFTEAEQVDLLPHFARFGEIEDCYIDEKKLAAIVTYRTRAEAEQAALHGVKLNSHCLSLSWHKPASVHGAADPGEPDPEDEEFQEEPLADDALLQDDDEEDDDNEPRPWRR